MEVDRAVLFVICSDFLYPVFMSESEEIRCLQEQVDRLAAENATLRGSPLTSLKAEAMLAFEYDRIPTVLKTPRAIRLQRRVSTVVLFVVPAIVALVAIFGGIDAYRDHEQSLETQRAVATWGKQFRDSVQRNLNP